MVRALEPDFALAACMGADPGSCVFCGACPLTGALDRARMAFLRELDAVTLADLAAPAAILRQRISLHSATSLVNR